MMHVLNQGGRIYYGPASRKACRRQKAAAKKLGYNRLKITPVLPPCEPPQQIYRHGKLQTI